MTIPAGADAWAPAEWTTARGHEGFVTLSVDEPYIDLLSDPDSFSVTQRVGTYGPVVIAEVGTDAPMGLHCGSSRNSYRINVPRSGRVDSLHRGASLVAGPGMAVLYRPEGEAASRWAAGSKLLSVRIDRHVVEEALSHRLGRPLTSQIDFTSGMSIRAPNARGWVNMLSLFADQLFRLDSVLRQPMVGLPYVDSLVHGLLLTADHSYRTVMTDQTRAVSPRAIRAAVEIMEQEAHLPLTVSSIAARCHVSVRSLQQDFQRYMETSPMAYLRDVRLRRAHQSLLETDPSVASVASVAYQWGFTNLGRFAAAHSARYHEPPAATLRRRPFRRTQSGVGRAR